MLGIILIYFIGKRFYNLAKEFEKAPWGYAILGVACYYAGMFIFQILVLLIGEFNSAGFIDSSSELLIGLVSIPAGLGATYLTYRYLKKRFENNYVFSDDILDSEFDDDPLFID